MALKVLLVWPNSGWFGFKPIGVAQLSSLLKRDGHEVELFDSTYIELNERKYSDSDTSYDKVKLYKPVDFTGHNFKKQALNIETEFTNKLKSFRPDIIGFSALSDEVVLSGELSKYAKKWNPHVTTIWGGKAATMLPEKILADPNVDYICRGEGFELILEFTEAIEKGEDPRDLENLGFIKDDKMVLNPLRPYFQNADSLPYLDLSIFDERQFLKPFQGKLYRGAEHMLYWGCPFKCSYCLVETMRQMYGKDKGRYMRGYSVPRIVEELKFLTEKYEITMWKFFDEEFASKPLKMWSELVKLYNDQVRVPFSCMVSACSLNEQKVDLLAQMRCINVSMGYESGNEDLRTMVLRRKENTDQIVQAAILCKNAGVRTSSYNMIGLPYESRQTLFQTVELNKKAGVQDPSVNFWYPLEGTELWKIAIEEGLYDPENCEEVNNREGGDKPHIPIEGMTSEEVIAFKKRFHIYVKLPYEFFKYIKRSEIDDELGQALFLKLLDIYEKQVLLTDDGLWNQEASIEDYLAEVEKIVGREDIPDFDYEILEQSTVENKKVSPYVVNSEGKVEQLTAVA